MLPPIHNFTVDSRRLSLKTLSLDWHVVRRMFREAREKVVHDATYLHSRLAVATVVMNCRHEFSPLFPIDFLTQLAHLERIGLFLGIPPSQVVQWVFLRKELAPTLRRYCIFDSPEQFIYLVGELYNDMAHMQDKFPEITNVLFMDLFIYTADKLLDELSLSQPAYLAALQPPEISAPSVR